LTDGLRQTVAAFRASKPAVPEQLPRLDDALPADVVGAA
jgi:hypothetical protein